MSVLSSIAKGLGIGTPGHGGVYNALNKYVVQPIEQPFTGYYQGMQAANTVQKQSKAVGQNVIDQNKALQAARNAGLKGQALRDFISHQNNISQQYQDNLTKSVSQLQTPKQILGESAGIGLTLAPFITGGLGAAGIGRGEFAAQAAAADARAMASKNVLQRIATKTVQALPASATGVGAFNVAAGLQANQPLNQIPKNFATGMLTGAALAPVGAVGSEVYGGIKKGLGSIQVPMENGGKGFKGFAKVPGNEPPKANKFFIAQNPDAPTYDGNPFKEVPGKPVDVVPGVNTFIHRNENGNWTITEVKTGRSVTPGEGFKTRAQAISAAQDNFNKAGIDKVKKALAEYPVDYTAPSNFKPIDARKPSVSAEAAQLPKDKPLLQPTLTSQSPVQPLAIQTGNKQSFATSLNPRDITHTFVSNRNVRIAESNQIASDLEHLLPKKVDREATFIYHELKNNPEKITQLQQELAAGNEQLKPYQAQIKKALNPTPEMQAASNKLSQYFEGRQAEGQQLGYIKGNVSDYITHIIQKGDSATGLTEGVGRPAASRRTPFGQGRVYPTILDTIMAGKNPATLDVADVTRIYGTRDAIANATHQTINLLKDSGNGQWVHPGETPLGMTDLSQYGHTFQNILAVTGKEGQPLKVTQNFVVPTKIANALKPILEPDYFKKIGGLGKLRATQQIAKYIELSLSFFHAKALTITAANSNPLIITKAAVTDMASQAFKSAERDLIKDGGTTSMLGGEYNAFRNIRQGSKNILVNNPITRAFNALADKTSGVTFDILQRKYKVLDYSMQKSSWLAKHPTATQAEIDAAGQGIAKYVNSVYGGLNWEELGMTKSQLSVLRSLLLAPDWTISNFALIPQALKGQIGTKKAAQFIATGFASGIALTQLHNVLLNGKPDMTDPFNVTIGYRKDGTRVKANLYFAGGTNDMVKAFNNIKEYGPIGGLATFGVNKAAPFVKNIGELITNRDYNGNPIYNAGKGIIGNTKDTLSYIGTNVIPSPISLSTPIRQIISGKQTGSTPLPSELLLSTLGIAQISKDNPAKDAYNQVYDQQISQGKSDLSARLTALTAKQKVQDSQKLLQSQGVTGQKINEQATQTGNNLVAINQAKNNMSGNGVTVAGDKALVKISGTVKEFDTVEEAKLALEKDAFKNSNQSMSYSTDGSLVYTKSKNGSVTTTPAIVFENSLNTAKLAQAKAKNDLKTWLAIADNQVTNIQKQLTDPTTNPLEALKLQNSLATLQSEAAKFTTYGGFTKPKKPKKPKAVKVTKIKTSRRFTTPKLKISSVKGKSVKAPKLKLSSIKFNVPKKGTSGRRVSKKIRVLT